MSENEDPAFLWPGHVSRSVSFEDATTSRGRKESPMRVLAGGERVVLAELAGPGRVTHLWMTVGALAPHLPAPHVLRAQVLEVFLDGLDEPSVSAPVPDFFGAVHGVPAAYASRLTAVNEGRGLASRVPMPFRSSVRLEYENASPEPVILYYQVDVLLGPLPHGSGLLHAAFRRENPTTIGRDFTIAEGLRGPGRFLGWTGGVRVLDPRRWWGEGEVKVYVDGDETPAICGTGTEDHVDSAWGLGTFAAPESGAPLVLGTGADTQEVVSLYRWHLSDPVVFGRDLRVTIQQIGSAMFRQGEEAAYAEFRERVIPAGRGWLERLPEPLLAIGLYERSDDWCATSFVYCEEPQPVPRVDVAAATADLGGATGRPVVR